MGWEIMHVIHVSEYNKNLTQITLSTDHGYTVIFKHCKYLIKLGLISMTKPGRENIVKLTPLGKKAMKLYDEIIWRNR